MDCLVDGYPTEALPLDDRGLLYGDGLFETIAVRAGRPELPERHFTRLEAGCRRLGLEPPCAEAIAADVAALFADGGDGVLRLTVTRGSGGRGYAAPVAPAIRRIACRHPLPAQADPAVTVLCHTRLAIQPGLAGLKHINRLEQVLARQEVDERGADEGLVSDMAGTLIEATAANLFIVRDGWLLTPDLSGAGVAGIMRGLVLEEAEANGIPWRTGLYCPADLLAADEIFLTNSLIRLRPVARVEGRVWSVPGPVTRRLAERIEERLGAAAR